MTMLPTNNELVNDAIPDGQEVQEPPEVSQTSVREAQVQEQCKQVSALLNKGTYVPK